MYRRLATALAIGAVAASCGGVVDPSQNQNETRNGTMNLASTNTASIQTFNVSKSGEISVTVTNLTPTVSSGTYFAVGLGQNVSGQCSLISQPNQFSVVGTAAINGPITPGSYCVLLYDEGLFTVNENYTIVISHP